MSLSLSDNSTIISHRDQPFPYIVIKDVLPTELCNRLIDEYPTPDFLQSIGINPKANNLRWGYPAFKVRSHPNITDAWQEVLAYLTSQAFFEQCLAWFGSAIVKLYPNQYPTKHALYQSRLGIRKVDDFTDKDLLIDAKIAGNTPVTQASSVRTNHIDAPTKLISGLLYLRTDDDNSSGGDLEIRQFKPNYCPTQQNAAYEGVYVDNKHTEIVETVAYDKNVLVLFVNSPKSFHGVTVRNPTPHHRRFINIICTVEKPLFKVPGSTYRHLKRKYIDLLKKRADQLLYRLKNRLNIS